jgi:hypothetical protein
VIPSPERCRGGQVKFARDRFEVLPALQPRNRRKLAIRRPTDSLTRKRLRSVRYDFRICCLQVPSLEQTQMNRFASQPTLSPS